jgi:hypothetical protein
MKVWCVLVLDGVVKDATKAILTADGDVDDMRKAVKSEWELKIPAAELRVYGNQTEPRAQPWRSLSSIC